MEMKVIITAGGTGGHIYPALAIINKIKEKEPNSTFLYIGTHNRMEKDIIPEAKIPYASLEIYGFSKNMKQNLKNVFLVFQAQRKCRRLISEFKPDIVIGTGGYVSYPVIKMAHKLGYKTAIHEQNAIPGKSNRVLAKSTDLVCVSFEESSKYFPHNKVIVTGNPRGEDAFEVEKANKKEFGLTNNKKLILIVGGSLGSSALNEKIVAYLKTVAKEEFEVLFITGKEHFNKINKFKFPANVVVKPYINNLYRIMKTADIMVTRAGASTISEILALGIPSIFIPSPYVANNHQYFNALALVNAKAGKIIAEKDLNTHILTEEINNYLNDKELYLDTKINMQRLAVTNSSSLIYRHIKDLIK